MTTINHPHPHAAEYWVEIVREGRDLLTTGATRDREAAVTMHAALKASFPEAEARLMMLDRDGRQSEATREEMDRLDDINRAMALAALFDRRLPRITWTLTNYESDKLRGHADTREEVEEYARLLGVEVAEYLDTSFPTVKATGVFEGIGVRVSCHVPVEQPAAVTA